MLVVLCAWARWLNGGGAQVVQLGMIATLQWPGLDSCVGGGGGGGGGAEARCCQRHAEWAACLPSPLQGGL